MVKENRICVVNFPMSKAGGNAASIPIMHLLEILSSIASTVYLIAGEFVVKNISKSIVEKELDDVKIQGITHRERRGFWRIINYIVTQVKISVELMKIIGDIDFCIFFMMGQDLLLPMLTVKLYRKKVILAPAASSVKSTEAKRETFSKVLDILSDINYTLSDGIILYSQSLIGEWGLERYRNKIRIAHRHFLNLDEFRVKKKFGERDNVIGYIGRLSEEKGVLNFVKAIPEILRDVDEVSFLIGGDGSLRNEIRKYIDENNLNKKVRLVGWIPHDELPNYLNELKLIVLPSFTEGLPNIMLEAMACGTPVLATSVGAIPDIITDGETGFIIKDNPPEHIVRGIIRVLNYPNLEEITRNAHTLIKEKFTYEKAVEKWRGIFENIFVS